MMTPAILEVAPLPPGTCMICGCNSGPMIDTMVQYDIYGRQYICLQRCVPMLAELTGYVAPAALEELQATCDRLQTDVAELGDALVAEKDNKVVSLEDFRKFAKSGPVTV